MADLTHGNEFGATEEVTATKLHNLVDNATISNIATADISDSAITNAKISDVSGAKFTGLANIPAGSGVIPKANLTSVAQKGANSDITSLSGLTTALSTAQGGTGATANANAANGVVVLDANSKISVAQLGSWVDKSASYGAQQAAADGFVVMSAKCDTSTVNTYIYGYTDANANPTTLRHKVAVNYPGANYDPMMCATFTMPVKKGNYWKVVADQTHIAEWLVHWIPLGS